MKQATVLKLAEALEVTPDAFLEADDEGDPDAPDDPDAE